MTQPKKHSLILRILSFYCEGPEGGFLGFKPQKRSDVDKPLKQPLRLEPKETTYNKS